MFSVRKCYEVNKSNRDGVRGVVAECVFKFLYTNNDYTHATEPGKPDCRIYVGNKSYTADVKTGGAELNSKFNPEFLCGASYCVFIPVVSDNWDCEPEEFFRINPGYILTANQMWGMLENAKLFREKKPSNCKDRILAIQTFYNHSLNAFHGRKGKVAIEICEGLVAKGKARRISDLKPVR